MTSAVLVQGTLAPKIQVPQTFLILGEYWSPAQVLAPRPPFFPSPSFLLVLRHSPYFRQSNLPHYDPPFIASPSRRSSSSPHISQPFHRYSVPAILIPLRVDSHNQVSAQLCQRNTSTLRISTTMRLIRNSMKKKSHRSLMVMNFMLPTCLTDIAIRWASNAGGEGERSWE